LPSAATLSRPRASRTSFLAASAPITRSAMPAAYVETTVRENSRSSSARKELEIVGCMFMGGSLKRRRSES
jgi:Cys-tRNA synthase (O-phospho-L-seryl-tRNA:Cys-tRNA synthase)